MARKHSLTALAMALGLLSTQANAAGVRNMPAAPSNTVPQELIQADGTYLSYTAKISDGHTVVSLGQYVRPRDCFASLQAAESSPEFRHATDGSGYVEMACIAIRNKA